MNRLSPSALAAKAKWVWRQTLMLHKLCPETRVASSLSCVEILCALYYGGVIEFDGHKPDWEDRDRFIISKGHGSISFFPILADLGFVEMSELEDIGKPEGVFKAIPDTLIPGYETINGSVGQGLSVAVGIALALDRQRTDQSVFVLSGDGELSEGLVWEAVMFAGHHGLDNLILVVDNNGASMLDFCANTIDLDPLDEKFRMFGWDTMVVDGHDLEATTEVLSQAKTQRSKRPIAVIANTLKGRGIDHLETDPISHVRVLGAPEIDDLLEKTK